MQPTDHKSDDMKSEVDHSIEPDELAESIHNDAEMSITTSTDKMRADVSYTPPTGDCVVDVEMLVQQLVEQGFEQALIDLDALQLLVESELEMTLCVVNGRPAEHGDHAKFEVLYELEQQTPPDVADDGTVNYFETKHYAWVAEGDPLMRRVPATDGTHGMNIHGKTLKAKRGKNLKLRKQKGSMVAEEDENLLLATISGHPLLKDRGVMVQDTLALPRADLKSGNVHYDGSILINGDVTSQVVLEASGDIYVKGTVENATLIAKGNIVIGGGVLSESVADESEALEHHLSAELTAGIDIHARFLNFTQAKAGRDIVVQNYCMHCHIQSGRDIIVGEKGGAGSLICGASYALHDIKVNTLGSPAYLQTVVTSGNMPELLFEKDKVERRLVKRNREHEQLTAIMAKVEQRDQPEMLGELVLDKKKKVNKALATIEVWQQRLTSELELLNAQLVRARSAHVLVKKTVFPNTHVLVNGKGHLVASELGGSNFHVVNGRLKIN